MSDDRFRTTLMGYFDDLQSRVTTDSGEWTVKGFIDVYQRIYTLSLDTKVLSKVLELLMFPVLQRFANDNQYDWIFASAQNHYPDLTLIAKNDPTACYAIDIKTTYRKQRDGNKQKVLIHHPIPT